MVAMAAGSSAVAADPEGSTKTRERGDKAVKNIYFSGASGRMETGKTN